MNRIQIIASIILALLGVGHAFFWIVGKSVSLNYHPENVNVHWLYAYPIHIAAFDIFAPVIIISATFLLPRFRNRLLILGYIILFSSMIYQTVALSEAFLRAYGS